MPSHVIVATRLLLHLNRLANLPGYLPPLAQKLTEDQMESQLCLSMLEYWTVFHFKTWNPSAKSLSIQVCSADSFIPSGSPQFWSIPHLKFFSLSLGTEFIKEFPRHRGVGLQWYIVRAQDLRIKKRWKYFWTPLVFQG